MDFYDALMKYEDIFGDIIKKNLDKFNNKIKEIINNEKQKIDKIIINDINNKNIIEILKEIESSDKLKKLIQLKYHSINKNKCFIFAKDNTKIINRNYNNQKGLLNNNIKGININENEIKYEIKEIKNKIKNSIKNKFLLEINKEREIKFKNLTERNKINAKSLIKEIKISKSRDSKNLIPINKNINFEDKIKSPLNTETKNKKSVYLQNVILNSPLSPNNDRKNKRKNFDIFKTHDNRIITDANQDKNQLMFIKNIKINNENKEKSDNKNIDNRPFSHKKIEISKFKIGNHGEKCITNIMNNDNIKKKKMIKIKSRLETKNFDYNKIKINFKGKRILSSKMIIKEEDKFMNN